MTDEEHTKGKDTIYDSEEEERQEVQMDTGIDSGTLAIFQASAEANTRINILRRITLDSKDAVPVKTICQIFDWKVPEAAKRRKMDRSKVVDLFKSGKSPKQIATMFGTDEMSIREVLKAMNLIDQGTTI